MKEKIKSRKGLHHGGEPFEFVPLYSRAIMQNLGWLNASRQAELDSAIKHSLPPTYNFEIYKTLMRLHEGSARRVCLQCPEGLMVWIESVAHIIQEFGHEIEACIIMGDVTYGACCIDDIKAKHLMNCDFLVHYAHSCLVPLDSMHIKCLYIFVEIYLDPLKLARSLHKNLPPAIEQASSNQNPTLTVRNIAILGTIQFSKCVHTCAQLLKDQFWPTDNVFVPQQDPLSAGETLGCTSVKLPADTHIAIFISDGRFHIESAMIQNPHVAFYRYDPFIQKLFTESYDLPLMLRTRHKAIEKARHATSYMIILSTLGRQGCVGLVDHLYNLIRQQKGEDCDVDIILLSEINPEVIRELSEPGCCWVNVGCPRLCIDWGTEYDLNMVNSYELVQALKNSGESTAYPMDYFASDGGEWSNGPYRRRKPNIAELRAKWLQRKQEMTVGS